jgi:hypothetical protein
VKAQDRQCRSDNSDSHGWIALFHSLHRFQVDHHAFRHFAHRHVSPLAGDGNVLTQLLDLTNRIFG